MGSGDLRLKAGVALGFFEFWLVVFSGVKVFSLGLKVKGLGFSGLEFEVNWASSLRSERAQKCLGRRWAEGLRVCAAT